MFFIYFDGTLCNNNEKLIEKFQFTLHQLDIVKNVDENNTSSDLFLHNLILVNKILNIREDKKKNTVEDIHKIKEQAKKLLRLMEYKEKLEREQAALMKSHKETDPIIIAWNKAFERHQRRLEEKFWETQERLTKIDGLENNPYFLTEGGLKSMIKVMDSPEPKERDNEENEFHQFTKRPEIPQPKYINYHSNSTKPKESSNPIKELAKPASSSNMDDPAQQLLKVLSKIKLKKVKMIK